MNWVEQSPLVIILVAWLGFWWKIARLSRTDYPSLVARRDQPKRDAERLEVLRAERENYLLLRKTWQPVPGSPLDWSLGLSQDQVQAEIAELEKRVKESKPKPPPNPASPRPPRGGSGQSHDEWLVQLDAHYWQQLSRELREKIKAEQARNRATKRVVHELHDPPTTGRWTPPDYLKTENV